MRKIIKRGRIILIVVLLLAVIAVYVYDPIAAVPGWPMGLSSHFRDAGLYRIEPETILASLREGKTDVFLHDSRLLEDRVSGPSLYNEPAEWSQSDNLEIARALNDFVWKDSFDDWNLFDMTFDVDCEDNLKGLSGGVFRYFKTTFEKGRIAYTWREIEIDAEYAYAAWGGDADFAHPVLGWKSIDLGRLKITAEDAIKIAENNGGREARLRVQNQCSIQLLLMPERYRGWQVDYGYSSKFEIEIDPYTGEVIK